MSKAKTSTQASPTVKQLLDTFHVRSISYCHWKSNENIGLAVQGEEDLDILFDSDQRSDVHDILIGMGFRLFNAPSYKKYPGIDDYISIDGETGNLLHVHAHFKLLLGETGIKSYHLPWEKELLKTRVWNEKYCIYVSKPVMELLLLYIRLVLKEANLAKKWGIGSWTGRIKNEIKEAEDENTGLKKIVTAHELYETAEYWLDKSSTKAINKLYEVDTQQWDIENSARVIKRHLKPYRRFGDAATLYFGLKLQVINYILRAGKKIGLNTEVSRRRHSGNGKILVFIGTDGTGKSTMTQKVTKTLGKKVDVHFEYMGYTKGSKGIALRTLEAVKALIGLLTQKGRFKEAKTDKDFVSPNEKKELLKGKKKLALPYLFLYRILIAREKKKRLKRIWKLKNKGVYVVCDRFPQTTIKGYNDGPLLKDYLESKSRLLRYFAQKEINMYNIGHKYHPDIVFRLYADIETLHARRPETATSEIKKKQDDNLKIEFSENTNIINIDTNMPIEKVYSEVMKGVKNIW